MQHLFSIVIVALVVVSGNAIPLAPRYDTTVTTTNSQGETTTATSTINPSPPSPPTVTFDHAPTATPTTPAETADTSVVPVPAVAGDVAEAMVTEVVGEATIVHWPRIKTTAGWPTRDRSYVPTVWGRAPIGRVREARVEWLNKRSRDY